MTNRPMFGIVCLAIAFGSARPLPAPAAEPKPAELFARPNLVAWCIVPFDSKKRGPEERAAMLEKLGFSKFAYDYRAEHIPTFDQEIESLKRHKVELTAWWFPTSLNDEAKMTLAVFEKHKVTPQLWVTGGGGPTKDEADQRARVLSEVTRIRPIAEAAAKVGCKVALYNHGGWFGEPENQIAIIQELKLTNVGIVYNQHHGHEHLARFPELLQNMKPHLLCLNLNGMMPDGERRGQKIMQLGEGDLDLKLLKVVRDSGYTGPIGILGHTQDDAEERLHDNLDGLDWLLPQLKDKPAGPKPKMRTPVPKAVAAVVAPPARPNGPALVEGKFGKALDGRSGGALVKGRDEFRQFPLTVECWTKLDQKDSFNILVAHEQKSSGTHWELFTMPGGAFTVYAPGFSPDHCRSEAMICDGKWHHVAMVLESERIRLFVDAKPVADQKHKRTEIKSVPGELGLATLIDRGIGCSGLVDEVRVSKGVRVPSTVPDKPFAPDETTVALWHLDELDPTLRVGSRTDALRRESAPLDAERRGVRSHAERGTEKKIDGHWGTDAVGFNWTEADSRDDRFGQMDVGPFLSTSLGPPLAPAAWHDPVYKAIVVRVGSKRQASISYDTELLRASAGWTGFVRFDPARFGIIGTPRPDGPVTFVTPSLPGWTTTGEFTNFRADHRYGPLPKTEAHYEGLYRNGQRVVMEYIVGQHALITEWPPSWASVRETPWLEEADGVAALTRTLLIGPTKTTLRMLVADPKALVRLHARSDKASIAPGHGGCQVLTVEPHDKPVTIKLLIASPDVNEAAFDKLVAASPAPEDVLALTKPGPAIWGEPLVTKGELGGVEGRGLRVEGQTDKGKESVPPSLNHQPSTVNPAYVVDTITLPFKNPFNALLFCGGHDFLPDGRAVVCTLHGDVWIVDGIDEKLERITWRRFATGLFQPLGVKILPARGQAWRGKDPKPSIFVVGRDQITRLIDTNNDGEADHYENFNNDAHTTMNGHEYVTCLETDRAGNFYFVKGNCDSQTPHDGSLLRVSADGSKLDVFATGFRNSNGIGMGPNDEITVAPQEGEWTPASGLFVVREGGFYGAMMSHHQATPPTDFIRPLCWFSRRDDNSSGGQVWTTSDRFGPLGNQLLHLSYGQCKLRLIVRESEADGTNATEGTNDRTRGSSKANVSSVSSLSRGRESPGSSGVSPSAHLSERGGVSPLALREEDGLTPRNRGADAAPLGKAIVSPANGGSVELPLNFASGIHRGRMNPRDGQLYLTGLKGWVSSAVNDGCFQRVRFTGQSLDTPVAMKTYRNGVALTFTGPLQREAAEDPSSYQLEAWNYKWSAAYGSPEYKPSAPGQVGRDEVEPKSATLLEDNRTVFIELPNLKTVDQLAVGYTLLTEDSKALEQTVTLTLNSIPGTVMPERSLHRPKIDAASAALQERLVPGVEIHLPNAASPMTRRLMAWTWVNVLENTREIRATAYLRIPATGQYRFNAEVDRAATLEINGQTFSLGEKDDVPIRLSRGLTRVTVRHLTTRRSSHFRLLWESDRFPREAVPPHVLFHDPHEGGEVAGQRRTFLQGRALFAEHHCARCHVHWPGTVGGVVPETLAEARRGAPRLDGIGSRLKSDWLAAWLRDPAHLRADATMPRLHETANDAELNDLLAHLETLRDDASPTDATAATDAAEGPPVTAGAVTFERLGCIACHTLSANGAADEWNRVSLHFAKSKFQPGRLVQYLLAPHRHHAGSRMPDFHLSEREAHQLAAYIEDRSSGAVTSLAPNRTGNAERGRTLFAKWRCGHCHTASPTDRLAEPDIRPAFHIPPAHGCLASQPNPKQVAPVFAWSDPERSAIREYVSAVAKGLASKYEPAEDMLPRLIASLRCNACHARDEVRSLWPEIVAEEGSGRAMEAVPQLTWVGEKLQSPWIEKLLKGEHKTKPRPWLTARMPSFPAYAGVIAHGMAAEHGVPFEEPLPKELDPEQIEIGRQLTLRDGGLDCRQCHGVGKEQPRGDASTQIALGINFALARERLRPEFALRQMLDPPRYDIGSRMPRFAPDLRTTAARHIEGGDARKQFEALKQFIWSVKEE